MAGSSIMDSLFQRTLDDLIKGLRLNPLGESAYLSKTLEEIRKEIKSTDPETKTTALHKLTYLHSIHALDMSSWASFHVVEVMSYPRFSQKKIGYLAASLSFHDSTDVILLVTNQLRKDLNSANQFEASLALHFLAVASNVDLSRDLTPELFTLLSSSKVFVKKKAIGVMLRVFGKYPDAVRVCFKRLVENLESSDPSVVSAVVGVFCELTAKEPNSYLPLAPEFYKILVDSKNNWLLIKVLKIFARLCPLEPRLARRVVEPICDHIRKTGAKSLVFECIRTIVTSLGEFESAVKLAVVKIHELLVDEDPNLKYLGLQALSILAPKHPWAVLQNKEFVIKSLSDTDPNIKLESLRLVMYMVSENNAIEICKVLVNYALKSDPEFCNVILGSLLSTCSRNFYEIVVDFDWYVSLLGDISRIQHCQRGEEIEDQLIDIGMRVRDARPELVRVGRDLLIDPALLGNPFLHRILSAAAWVSGEYVEFSTNPFELVEALLQPRTSLLPPSVRAIYIQSLFKVLSFCLHSYVLERESMVSTASPSETFAMQMAEGLSSACPKVANITQGEEFNPRNGSPENVYVEKGMDTAVLTLESSSINRSIFSHDSIENMIDLSEMSLRTLLGSGEVEILDRIRNVLGLIDMVKQQLPGSNVLAGEDSVKEESRASQIIELTYSCFSEELGPVSVNAQESVPIPDGLILTDNLSLLDTIFGEVQLPPSSTISFGRSCSQDRVGVSVLNSQSNEEGLELSTESTSLLAQHRKRHGLYYLPLGKNEVLSYDYPPANDPKLQEDPNDETDNLVKLAEQSLNQKKKSNNIKPRPVVVKLDEGDGVIVGSKMPVSRYDMLSGAVRDVLTGKEAVSENNSTKRSSNLHKGKEKVGIDPPSEFKRNDENKIEDKSVDSIRRKHRTQGKDRRHKTDGKVSDRREERGQKGKRNSSHHHGRHKARQSVVPETPIIPDFLL